MPTNTKKLELTKIASACGYKQCYQVNNVQELNKILEKVAIDTKLTFIEVKASVGARTDLGRPTTTAKENKDNFMKALS